MSLRIGKRSIGIESDFILKVGSITSPAVMKGPFSNYADTICLVSVCFTVESFRWH